MTDNPMAATTVTYTNNSETQASNSFQLPPSENSLESQPNYPNFQIRVLKDDGHLWNNPYSQPPPNRYEAEDDDDAIDDDLDEEIYGQDNVVVEEQYQHYPHNLNRRVYLEKSNGLDEMRDSPGESCISLGDWAARAHVDDAAPGVLDRLEAAAPAGCAELRVRLLGMVVVRDHDRLGARAYALGMVALDESENGGEVEISSFRVLQSPSAPLSVVVVSGLLKVFLLGNLKAPGPDGFPGLFYYKFWESVKDNVNQAASCFHSGNFSLDTLNRTNIVLIPKIPHPESVSHFRPISLCNNSVKILSKLLANRLKPILPLFISKHQNAFVPGRQIQDNIILAHEVYHYLKLKNSKSEHELALKLDMNKAFDRVEWDFLEAALLKFGFDTRWVKLVMSVVSTVSFSLLINGKRSRTFHPSRGIRQGDPLSPYLFLIIGEVLSRNIIAASNSNRLEGIKLSTHCPGITHLFFADDALFFMKATLNNCRSLQAIIDAYCIASGQSVNYDKSSIYFSAKTPIDVRTEISSALNIPISDNPGRYLGLPTIWGNSKRKALAYIRERIKQKLEGWKADILSQAGREVLIKSVAMAVPAYPMSVFLLPTSLCKAINSDIANFWWGSIGTKNKVHWKAWDHLCKSKADGGIGFKELLTFNKALLAKQCWRLINNPNSLWCRVLKARYFHQSSFLKAKNGSRPSWIWNSLIAGRETIIENACWQVGNGESIDVWKDCWVPNRNGGRIKPTDTSNRFTPLLVSEIIDEDRNWNISHLEPFLDPSDIRCIKAIPIGEANEKDKLIWPHTKCGSYSVKSGYYNSLPTSKSSSKDGPSSSAQIDKKIWNLDTSFCYRTWSHPLLAAPSPPFVKVNVDGAWDSKTYKSGIGVIIRNHRGQSIAGASILKSHNSPIEVEAEAVVKGLQLAAFLKLQNIILEGDCQELFHALNNSSSSPNWKISHMLNKVSHLKTLFTGIKWNWIPREANRVVDAAAKLAKLRLCSQDWANRPPTSLISILRSDGLPGPPCNLS
ncbi:uncharacterized protein LOC133722711 [Rosa rugosa]|uniref:uncharacterized protein LOC133722711 n=1 Tax=Rosa rugosa TaxID=74645 RepID=UPI002B402601|nr:uncharacterized protein LOC133722711 [Rosa rugosa]